MTKELELLVKKWRDDGIRLNGGADKPYSDDENSVRAFVLEHCAEELAAALAKAQEGEQSAAGERVDWRKELEAILADDSLGSPVDKAWSCLACGAWTPLNHPEAHDHEEGCPAHAEWKRRHDWRVRLQNLIAQQKAPEGEGIVLCRECGKPTMHMGTLCFHCSKSGSAAPDGGDVAAYRWLDDLRYRMEHCASAAEEGEDYNVSRDVLDAMTTLGLMEKAGRGKWRPTAAGRAFANAKPTLPIEIYGKLYEVQIPVQLHIVNLRDKISATPPPEQPVPVEGDQRCDQLVQDAGNGPRKCANKRVPGDTLCKRHRATAEITGYAPSRTIPYAPPPSQPAVELWKFVERAFDSSKTSTSERLLECLGLPSDDAQMPLSWHINRALALIDGAKAGRVDHG